MFEFKPEDFVLRCTFSEDSEHVSNKANELLQKEIASWPVVYGVQDAVDKALYYGTGKSIKDTHKARLAFIEPIVKEECKHKPQAYCSAMFGQHKCRHCGVELVVAEWKAK